LKCKIPGSISHLPLFILSSSHQIPPGHRDQEGSSADDLQIICRVKLHGNLSCLASFRLSPRVNRGENAPPLPFTTEFQFPLSLEEDSTFDLSNCFFTGAFSFIGRYFFICIFMVVRDSWYSIVRFDIGLGVSYLNAVALVCD